MLEDKKVLIAVYDRDGRIMGYKSDTFWALNPCSSHAKQHSLRDAVQEGRLARNLVSMMNFSEISAKSKKEAAPLRISVVSAANPAEELASYHIRKEGKKYACVA
jgi:hypothetical protein